jgi:hypothetical protein
MRQRSWVIIGVLGSLTACQQIDSAKNSLQTGQIVGGGTVQMADVQPVGGFLPQPALLQPGTTGEAALNYRNPAINFSTYHAVMLEPVQLWLVTGSPLDGVPQNQRQAAANLFYSDLRDAIQKHCQLTTTASPGVMTLQFAIVNAKLPNAALNTLALYAPYESTAYAAASLLFNKGVGYFAGTATVEGYATDAANGTLLWQGVDKRGGTTAAVENTLNTWLDVHHAFQSWSNQLVSRLQLLGVCTGG